MVRPKIISESVITSKRLTASQNFLQTSGLHTLCELDLPVS